MASGVEAHYYTTNSVSDLMLDCDDSSWFAHPPMRILEHSAGKGHLSDRLRLLAPQAQIDVVEVTPFYANILREKGHDTVHEFEFLLFKPDYKYHLILMHPPFSLSDNKNAYMDHIQHA